MPRAAGRSRKTACDRTFFGSPVSFCRISGSEVVSTREGVGLMVSRRANLCLESLETREAPATLVSATKLTYQDIDGDNVTVTLSKPLLNLGNVNSVFLFDTGTVDGFNATKQQLRTINLTAFGAAAAGTNITAVATH